MKIHILYISIFMYNINCYDNYDIQTNPSCKYLTINGNNINIIMVMMTMIEILVLNIG